MIKKLQNRRELFITAGRGVCLGVIGVVGGVLAVNRQIDYTNQECVKKRLCSGCGKFDDCRLPKADLVRGSMEAGEK